MTKGLQPKFCKSDLNQGCEYDLNKKKFPQVRAKSGLCKSELNQGCEYDPNKKKFPQIRGKPGL